MADFKEVWESPGGSALYTILVTTLNCTPPTLLFKPIPSLHTRVSTRPAISLQQFPFSLLLPSLSFPAPFLEKNTMLSKANVSGRAVWPLLLVSWSCQNRSPHLLPLVIYQSIFPDKDSSPLLLPKTQILMPNINTILLWDMPNVSCGVVEVSSNSWIWALDGVGRS